MSAGNVLDSFRYGVVGNNYLRELVLCSFIYGKTIVT